MRNKVGLAALLLALLALLALTGCDKRPSGSIGLTESDKTNYDYSNGMAFALTADGEGYRVEDDALN